ncbi:uncharacterized protein LOC108630379 [Ceratina calcarata]|uniref:Uncharacterized protein LOC108630379 n=1 Tax=Ceratina calcarata TaxID=156304 RepID=A0AAJ7JAZ1_9HYME|nr:uncharacterized protein LOC108630379 [Ceratina calcarata]XP_017889157.1 uncharacterized protein LOC108630379 [Ceratina calcarata]XP_017889158.1 uncharacterized protein LOC108630379 [Ceratina calcarata]
MELLSQNPQISTDSEIKGFDISAGKTWIYPENYPIRDYQFNIVKSCLYTNTLVCLPTGLGKTFIAAVIMYNFWRWYPRGKVVFLAPTKPLVAQQIDACHNVMGIPTIETVQLTGAVNQKQREAVWLKKRVIFATPQVFQNDLEKHVVPSDLVKCVVIDEAHKALGKHSYCECIRLLAEKNQYFRVLALSATPGNKIGNVHEVIQNLLIAHMELRDETSIDIVPYINKREVDVILVPLNKELLQYKERYILIMDRHVKVLLQNNVLRGNTANISKGRIFYISREYQNKTNKTGNYGMIMKTITVLLSMYHAYELLIRDGLRAFYKFYQDHNDKFWMNDELQLQELLDDIKNYLGPFPDAKALSEETIKDIPEDLVFGHTKFAKLKELLLNHFKNNDKNDTRAIVFVEYRQIVSEVYVLLRQCQPIIRPQMFVGQAGQKQKQQVEALNKFRSNHVNVLVSTSIGEEGLDVGEVDLIICFDVSQHSPIRLVQRMGRTGRKRDGHIIILVTDGKEYETLKSTMARRDSLNDKILNTSNICSSLYQNNPRMIPDHLTPECIKMHINVHPKTPTVQSRSGKGKLDKKDNKRYNNLKRKVNTESNLESGKDGGQFSMIKYLRNDQTKMKDCEIRTPNNFQNNIRNVVKSSDVKILTSDKDSLEFLTTCALINSEREGNKENENINESYIPQFPYIRNFFNFSIPGTEILECVSTLSDTALFESDKKELDNDSENENEKDLYVDDYLFDDVGGDFSNECVFEKTTNVDVNRCVTSKSRFEDIFDESDESDTSDNVEKKHDACASSVASGRCESSKSEKEFNKLGNCEFSKFEDILDDSSDDTEISCDSKLGFSMAENVEQTHINNINVFQETKIKDFSDTIKLCDSKLKTSEEANKNNCTSVSVCSKNLDTSNVSQTNHGRSQLSLESMTQEANNESDHDMFEDDSVLLQVCSQIDQLSSIDQMDTLNKDKVEENMDDNENEVDMELRLEEFEWDDCFEIPANPVKDDIKYTSEGTETSNKSVDKGRDNIVRNSSDKSWTSIKEPIRQTNNTSISKAGNNVEQNSSDDGWICVRKPITQKRNISVNIAESKVERYSLSESFISNSTSMAQKSNISVSTAETSIEKNSSDDGWISVKKPTNVSGNVLQESISEKLANIGKRKNSVCNFPINNSLDDGWFSNVKENRSPYFNKSHFDLTEIYSDTSFENEYKSRKSEAKDIQKNKRLRKRRKLNKARKEFLNDEAEVSLNDFTTDGSSGTDEDLEGFVSYTQNVHDTTDMHVHYLKSVRSPVKKPNGFIFKKPRELDSKVEIYSQPLSQLDDTYVNDSFCVAGDEIEDVEMIQEECLLEKAERLLKSRKRKRREKESNNCTEGNNRRNIIHLDSSSEDEIEIMRNQIRDGTQLART